MPIADVIRDTVTRPRRPG